MASVDKCLFLDAVPHDAPPTAIGDLRSVVESMIDGLLPVEMVFDAALSRAAAFLQNDFVLDWRVPDGPGNPDQPIPPAVLLGVVTLCKRLSESLAAVGGATSVKTGDLAVTYGDEALRGQLPNDVRALLQPWRHPQIAGGRDAYMRAKR